MLRRLILVLAILASTGVGAQPAPSSPFSPSSSSSQYPNRPIRFFAPIPPGGGPDLVGRMLGAKLSDTFGVPVLMENRAGSNGNIAADAVIKSAPDGYTFLIGMDSLVAINPHLYRKMPFDSLVDLVPVASLVSNSFVLSVNPSLPVHSLVDFVEHARKSNPPLQYASGGNGSQHHLTMERLKVRAGIELQHIPYKGGAPATTATVAGEVAAMMSGTSTAAQIKAGRLRAIAVTGLRRSSVLPDVPTIAELYPEFEMIQWYGMFAPIGVPEPIITRIRTEINKALMLPDIREKLRNLGGVEPWITTQSEFGAAIRSDHAKYGKLVRELGATIAID